MWLTILSWHKNHDKPQSPLQSQCICIVAPELHSDIANRYECDQCCWPHCIITHYIQCSYMTATDTHTSHGRCHTVKLLVYSYKSNNIATQLTTTCYTISNAYVLAVVLVLAWLLLLLSVFLSVLSLLLWLLVWIISN